MEKEKFEIWYYKPGVARDITFDLVPVSLEDLNETHVWVSMCDEMELEQVYHNFQGENLPESDGKCIGIAAGHTSMSVGDVVVKSDGAYIVAQLGFTKLGPEFDAKVEASKAEFAEYAKKYKEEHGDN